MRYIPNTETLVSELRLGTMMYGDQISEQDAIAQLDTATKVHGINFIVSIEPPPHTFTYKHLSAMDDPCGPTYFHIQRSVGARAS